MPIAWCGINFWLKADVKYLYGSYFYSGNLYYDTAVLQMNALHLLNNRVALAVLYATMQFPFAIFCFVRLLRSIPRDYEEAAMIDGCGPFRILIKVIMPMAKPGNCDSVYDFSDGCMERISGCTCYVN